MTLPSSIDSIHFFLPDPSRTHLVPVHIILSN